jgi:hypothetical protein
MIVAADHMRHAHVVIVDHHREHIGRRAVRAQEHEIVELGILDGHLALDEIVDRRRAFVGRLQAHDMGRIGIVRRLLTPGRADAQRLLRRFRLGAHLGELVGGEVTAIGRACLDHRMRDLGVARGAFELIDFRTVPIEAQPAHPIEDRLDRRLGRARAIGVLNPQQEFAAMMACEQQVEERGARASDMQESGGRGRKTGNDSRAFAHAGSRCAVIRCCAQPRMLPDLKNDGQFSRRRP